MPRTEETNKKIREERRKGILDAAAEVFLLKGVAGTRIDDLARAAGISQGLIYRYFANLEDVLAALVDQAVRRAAELSRIALDSREDPWEKLRHLTEVFLLALSKQSIHYGLVCQVFAVPGRAQGFALGLDALRVAVREIIVGGQKAGRISTRDADQLVTLYIACLYGLAADMVLNGPTALARLPDSDAVLQILRP